MPVVSKFLHISVLYFFSNEWVLEESETAVAYEEVAESNVIPSSSIAAKESALTAWVHGFLRLVDSE
ncbi:MAG: hypothetical protein ACMG6E_08025 [Candidatus Roizmanbacteria bacterium]